ncbi:hypothetical protein CPL0016902_CDS0048 [Escherichia phage tunus]
MRRATYGFRLLACSIRRTSLLQCCKCRRIVLQSCAHFQPPIAHSSLNPYRKLSGFQKKIHLHDCIRELLKTCWT